MISSGMMFHNVSNFFDWKYIACFIIGIHSGDKYCIFSKGFFYLLSRNLSIFRLDISSFKAKFIHQIFNRFKNRMMLNSSSNNVFSLVLMGQGISFYGCIVTFCPTRCKDDMLTISMKQFSKLLSGFAKNFTSSSSVAMNARWIAKGIFHNLCHSSNSSCGHRSCCCIIEINQDFSLFLFIVSKQWTDWFSFMDTNDCISD